MPTNINSNSSGGGRAHKAGLFYCAEPPTSPTERVFNYRCDKEDMREFKCKGICHPASGNRTLTTQQAVQISSGSEITEHLPTSVERSMRARQTFCDRLPGAPWISRLPLKTTFRVKRSSLARRAFIFATLQIDLIQILLFFRSSLRTEPECASLFWLEKCIPGRFVGNRAFDTCEIQEMLTTLNFA